MKTPIQITISYRKLSELLRAYQYLNVNYIHLTNYELLLYGHIKEMVAYLEAKVFKCKKWATLDFSGTRGLAFWITWTKGAVGTYLASVVVNEVMAALDQHEKNPLIRQFKIS